MSDEIEAARVAAHAAIRAAWIQGLSTFAAGIAALFAGILAYCGVIRAAARQVQLDERRHQARVAAYRFRIEALTDQLEGRAGVAFGEATIALKRFHDRGDRSHPIPVYSLPNFPEFSQSDWEDHALLGQAAVRAIHALNSNLSDYEVFREEVCKGNLKCGDFAESSFPIGDPIENDDGSVTFRICNVVEQNEILARKIIESVRDLEAAIKPGI